MTHTLLLAICATFAVAAIVSCADTRVNVAAYDDSCSEDVECVAVVSGDVCECGDHCGAIARAEEDRYDADVNELTGCGFSVAPACPNGDDPFAVCAQRPASCSEGSCIVDDRR